MVVGVSKLVGSDCIMPPPLLAAALFFFLCLVCNASALTTNTTAVSVSVEVVAPAGGGGGGLGVLSVLNFSLSPEFVEPSKEIVFYAGGTLPLRVRFKEVKLWNSGSILFDFNFGFSCLKENDSKCFASSCRVVESRSEFNSVLLSNRLLSNQTAFLTVECSPSSALQEYALFKVTANNSAVLPSVLSRTVLLAGKGVTPNLVATGFFTVNGFDLGSCAVGFGNALLGKCSFVVSELRSFTVYGKTVYGVSWLVVIGVALLFASIVFVKARQPLALVGGFVLLALLVAWLFS